MTQNIKQKDIPQEIRELILARLEVLSSQMHFSSGNSSANISRDEMIQHVTDGDDIGRDYIETELRFLRALKKGIVGEILQPSA